MIKKQIINRLKVAGRKIKQSLRSIGWRVGSYRRRSVEKFYGFFERHPALVPVRKVVVGVVGTVFIMVGLAIGWIPGPGGFIAVIGLVMLASEFHWVRRLVRASQALVVFLYCKITGKRPNWIWRIKKKIMPERL